VKDRSVFIAAALESIELIQTYTEGYDLPGFLNDRKTQDAVVRNLEIIGLEFLNQLKEPAPEKQSLAAAFELLDEMPEDLMAQRQDEPPQERSEQGRVCTAYLQSHQD
jgi:hypothetical protein